MMKKLLCIVAALALVACGANTANAAFELTLDIPGGAAGADIRIADNYAGPGFYDEDPTVGMIQYSSGVQGGVGPFAIVVTVGLSKPALPLWQIDMFNVSVTGGAGAIDIAISDTDFPQPPPTMFALQSQIGGTTNGQVWAQCWLDSANLLWGVIPGDLPWNPDGSGAAQALVASGPAFTTGLQGPYGGAFSETRAVGITDPGVFSMTEIVRIVHGGPGQVTSFDYKNQLIPEPATYLIWSVLGAFGIALHWWRRRKAA